MYIHTHIHTYKYIFLAGIHAIHLIIFLINLMQLQTNIIIITSIYNHFENRNKYNNYKCQHLNEHVQSCTHAYVLPVRPLIIDIHCIYIHPFYMGTYMDKDCTKLQTPHRTTMVFGRSVGPVLWAPVCVLH